MVTVVGLGGRKVFGTFWDCRGPRMPASGPSVFLHGSSRLRHMRAAGTVRGVCGEQARGCAGRMVPLGSLALLATRGVASSAAWYVAGEERGTNIFKKICFQKKNEKNI